MSNPYNGNAAGINEDSAVTITEPADGDDLNAASANTALSKLADLVEYLRANTVKRTLAALGASSPNGQTGPVPYNVAATEAFDFRAAVQTHSDPHPIGKYIPIAGDDGSGDSRTYYDTNGDLVISRGCYFIEGPVFARYWERSGTRTGAAYKFTFSIGGLIVQVKNAGAAGDTWADNAWDKTLTLDTSSGVQGDVLGVISGSVVGFGRPREGGNFPNTFAAGWTAGANIGCYKDACGRVQWYGELSNPNSTLGATQLAVCNVPAAYQPAGSFDFHLHTVLPCYGSASGSPPWSQRGSCIAEYNGGNLDLYNVPSWSGYMVVGLNQLSYLP